MPYKYNPPPQKTSTKPPPHHPTHCASASTASESPRYSTVRAQSSSPTAPRPVMDHTRPQTPILALSVTGPRRLVGSPRNDGRFHCSWLGWPGRRCWRLRRRRGILQSRRELFFVSLNQAIHSIVEGVLLLECRKPPIIWTCGGERQRISSREASWAVAIGNNFLGRCLPFRTQRISLASFPNCIAGGRWDVLDIGDNETLFVLFA